MGFPTMMYKLDKGEIVSEIFDSEDIPKGWVDGPAKCKPKKEKKVNGDSDTTD